MKQVKWLLLALCAVAQAQQTFPNYVLSTPSPVTVNATDRVPIVQSGITQQATVGQVRGGLNLDATGATDQTATINAAISASAATCNQVTLPAGGTYLIAGQITLASCVPVFAYGATLNYTGTSYAVTTPPTGSTNNAFFLGATINLTSASAGAMRLGSCYRCTIRDIRVTGTSGTTNTIFLLDTNTTGTVSPVGNLNTNFNHFDNWIIDQETIGTGIKLVGTSASNVTTDNTFVNFHIAGGQPNNGAVVCGIDFNQWADTNTFAGEIRIGLSSLVSPANAQAVCLSDGGNGVYAETFQTLAVDTFGSPAVDNRQGIVATNGSTVVKFFVVDLYEFGPGNPTGAINAPQLLSSYINQAPRGSTNYQSIQFLGSNMGIGTLAFPTTQLTMQNSGQSSGVTQYDAFAQTPCFNAGSPSLCIGYAAQASLSSSASVYNVASQVGFYAANVANGANSSANNDFSFYDAGQTGGTVHNYGYYSLAASPTFAFYGAGTGPSQMFGAWTFSPSASSTVPVTITAPTGANAMLITPSSGQTVMSTSTAAGVAAQISLYGNASTGANGFFLQQTGAGDDVVNGGAGTLHLQTATTDRITISNAGALNVLSPNLLISSTAPTISSGFGTGPSVTHSNGTASFSINVGTGGAATNGVVGLPTATNGWSCFASDTGTTPTGRTDPTASTASSVTLTNYSRTTGSPVAWTASEIIQVGCMAN